jgi:hypothetical protein
LAKPILLFEPNAQFRETTVAAALLTSKSNQELIFYFPFGAWSETSKILGPLWYKWGLAGAKGHLPSDFVGDRPVTNGAGRTLMVLGGSGKTMTILWSLALGIAGWMFM